MTAKDEFTKLLTPELLAMLAGSEKKQDIDDMRATLIDAVEAHEQEFAAYFKANKKTMEARLVKKTGVKITTAQKNNLEDAEKSEKRALDMLFQAIEPEEQKNVAKFLPQAMKIDNNLKAAAAHAQELAKIMKTLVEQQRGVLFSCTIVDCVAGIAAATTSDAQGNAETELRKRLECDPLTKELSLQERIKLFDMLTCNPAAILATNAAANPVDSTVRDVATRAVTGVQNLPAKVLAEVKNMPKVMATDAALTVTTGMPPGTLATLNMFGNTLGQFTGMNTGKKK